MQLFPLYTRGENLISEHMAEYSFAKVTTPACTEISLESPWDVQSWEQLNTSKGNSNHLFFSASAIKDIIPAHITTERKSTHQ